MAVDYTFARPSPATVVDHEGIIWHCKIDEARFQGARRVENLATGSVTETITVKDAADYQLTISGDDAATAVCTEAFTGTLTADGVNRISWPGGVVKTSSGTSLTITVSGTLTELQLEEVTGQANQNPSEYVSNGLGEDHGCGKNVDGVKYFDYKNGNTVDANGVVTEAKGSAIPGIAYLNEAASTNVVLTSADIGETAGTSEWAGYTYFPTNNLVPSIFPGGVAFQATSKSSTGRARTASVTSSLIVEDQFWVASFYVEVFKGQGGHPSVKFGVYDGGTGGSLWGAAGLGGYDVETEILSLASATNSDSSVSMKKLNPVGPNGGQVILFNMVFNAQHFTGVVVSQSIYPMGTTTPLDGGMTIIHGGQLEKGKTPSSFIITDASPVLRAADKLSYSNVAVNEDFVAACEVTNLISTDEYPSLSTSGRYFGTDDSGGNTAEIRTTLLSPANYTLGASGGAFFSLGDAFTPKDERGKTVFSAEATGAIGSIGKIFSNGEKELEITRTDYPLSHSDLNIWGVGSWAGGSGDYVGLYHSFQLFDQPLTDEQLTYLSKPGNNPQGCS